MPLDVRPGGPDDDAAPFLYVTSPPFYDRMAGGREGALRVLRAVYRTEGHAASFEVCRVAELDGRLAGLLAGFPAAWGDRMVSGFSGAARRRLPPWRWPMFSRLVRVGSAISPTPPRDSWYVDALAVAPDARRRGVALALLHDAAERARTAGCTSLSLDTAIDNPGARRLYEGAGFEATEVVEMPPEARRLFPGPGIVAYVRGL